MNTGSWRYLSIGLLLLFACGRSAEPSVSVLGDALAAAEDAGTARVEMTMSMDLGPMGAIASEVVGVQALDGTAGDLEMTFDIAGASMSGTFLVVGSEAFVEREIAQLAFQLQPPPTAKWVRFDVAAFTGGVTTPQGGAGMDPTQMLDFLRAAGDVREAGSEEVRGTPTTRYDATVVMGEMIEATGADLEEMMRAQAELNPAAAVPDGMIDAMIDAMRDLEYDTSVWVGSDGLPRRIDAAIDMAPMFEALGAGADVGELAMTMRAEFFDFGVPVDVERPPSAEIWDPSGV